MVTVVIGKILILLGITLPFLILSFDRKRNNYKSILLFVFYYLGWCFFNSPLRGLVINTGIIESKWNWEGKLLDFIFSVLFISVFYYYFEGNNFFTFRQNKKSVKPILIAILSILFFSALITYFTSGTVPFDIDTLAFQLTMPGLDEEFAHRGIMMGLLLTALKPSFIPLKSGIINPAIFVTALLFGLVHGLPLTPFADYRFDFFAFGYTFIFGLIWGWMALKSRSVLTPVISHCANNFVVTMITMLK